MSLKAIINSIFSGGSGTAITDNVIVRGDGSGGGIQGSLASISDSGAISGFISLTMNSSNIVSKSDFVVNDGIKNTFVDNTTGFMFVDAGDLEEWAIVGFTSAGAVTLIQNSTNVSTTQGTASSLNIYDNGTGVSIENKLGATKRIGWWVLSKSA